jgi:hypothetical protein
MSPYVKSFYRQAKDKCGKEKTGDGKWSIALSAAGELTALVCGLETKPKYFLLYCLQKGNYAVFYTYAVGQPTRGATGRKH